MCFEFDSRDLILTFEMSFKEVWIENRLWGRLLEIVVISRNPDFSLIMNYGRKIKYDRKIHQI